MGDIWTKIRKKILEKKFSDSYHLVFRRVSWSELRKGCKNCLSKTKFLLERENEFSRKPDPQKRAVRSSRFLGLHRILTCKLRKGVRREISLRRDFCGSPYKRKFFLENKDFKRLPFTFW
ncbi:hypothetical protein A0128_02615 [Leptospira tipperaryensis]|uniref:Uncharacterized protein n=1 Tax=Leptospira tipperaryensis TaxID=2564040 RepID=A0A1D7UTB7_9LEPT|nr:hypothetical protein A0128_02615 [Leptospira tipperaryensis]